VSIGNVTGQPIEATIGGKDYKVSLLTQQAKGRLERLCEKRARTALLEGKDQLTDEEFKLAWAAFLDKVAGGDFAYGGQTFRKWIESGVGTIALVQVLFGIDSPDDAERLVMEHETETSTALRSVFAASFRQTPAGN
jgi:hypothetical protein